MRTEIGNGRIIADVLDSDTTNSTVAFGYKPINENPTMFMLVGLPGSGKSFVAQCLYVINKEGYRTWPEIRSSDQVRADLLGDELDQNHNDTVFNELHKQIRNDLIRNRNVIYDATNLSKKRRRNFIHQNLRNVNCNKVCIVVMEPFEKCVVQNAIRERVVPDEILREMYLSFCPPAFEEGWDEIYILDKYHLYNPDDDKYSIKNLVDSNYDMDQDNSHHTLSLGDHLTTTCKYLKTVTHDKDENLVAAGLLHDIGKPFTKSRYKRNGKLDTESHYFYHSNVGAYLTLLCPEINTLPAEDFTDISNLIYFHMMTFQWAESKDLKAKYEKKLGERFVKRVMKLHDADIRAN